MDFNEAERKFIEHWQKYHGTDFDFCNDPHTERESDCCGTSNFWYCELPAGFGGSNKVICTKCRASIYVPMLDKYEEGSL